MFRLGSTTNVRASGLDTPRDPVEQGHLHGKAVIVVGRGRWLMGQAGTGATRAVYVLMIATGALSMDVSEDPAAPGSCLASARSSRPAATAPRSRNG